jgi:hypothetical protein
MFSEIAPTASNSTPAWAAALTALAGTVAAVLAKKRYNRTRQPAAPKADLITRTEFHQTLDALRDRQTASVMAISEKMDQNQKELVAAITHQGVVIEQRLDKLDTAVARLEERTKSQL